MVKYAAGSDITKQDLNDIEGSIIFTVTDGAEASADNHYPVNQWGTVISVRMRTKSDRLSSNFSIGCQFFNPVMTNDVYFRSFYNGTWQQWVKLNYTNIT